MIRFTFFRLLPIVAMFMVGLDAFAADEVDYRPNVHGTIRSRFEVATESGDYRFQVRNARVSIDGMDSAGCPLVSIRSVAPTVTILPIARS